MVNVTPKHTRDQLKAYMLQQLLRHLAPDIEHLMNCLPHPATTAGGKFAELMKDMDVRDN